jgi:hypothetical protein
MKLWIEHSTLFGDFSPTPPTGYFADMRTAGLAATQARYTSEGAAEAALIVSQLAPDYYTIADEPTTQNANFGFFPGNVPIFNTAQWGDFVQDVAQQILAAAPAYDGQIGAGSGTWEGRGYTERFAALPELDYVDFHIYPFQTQYENFLQNALDWADYVRAVAPEKGLTLGEAWLYKESAAELEAGLDHNTVFGRDVYSFWEPIDRQYLEVLFKLTHYKRFEVTMPFWSMYYFAYLTYGDPGLAGLDSLQLLSLAGQRATANIPSVTLTGTGQKFVEVLARPPDADGDGTPDTADTGDADGDGVSDQAETYCGSAAIEAARRPERTDPQFAGASDDGDAQIDEALPAGADAYDCDGDGYKGSAEAHVFTATNARDQDACGLTAWPADLVAGAFSTNKLNIQDLSSFIAPARRLNTSPADGAYDVRWDLVPGAGVLSDHINIQDMSNLTTLRPPMLGGPMAFNGPSCPWP